MNLELKTLINDNQTAPDCSGSPEVMKVIFSRQCKATAGSFCNDFRKKTLRTRAIAQSWNRLKKNKVVVKVHCTAHEYGMVNVTLWEDDVVGKGHNKINEKNFAQTKPAEVKKGIAETKFVLSPSFAKMAEAQKAKGDSSEGTTHEYYVTATIKDKNDANNNIEENVPPTGYANKYL